MIRDRIHIGLDKRGFIDKISLKNILGLDGAYNKDIFLLAMALGIDEPKEIEGARFGYVRYEYIEPWDRAMLCALLIGTMVEGDEVDDYIDFEKSVDLAEKCAEKGFDILEKIVMEVDEDDERLTARLMKKLDLWYNQNVGSDF